jgi:hypothetical protein
MDQAATQAKENAVSFEVKKDGLQQRQSGDWVLRLTVQAIDMHQRIVNASMGARFACVLVEIDDDEMPVPHAAKERDKWVDLGPARQAGMRCKEPVFWAWLTEECAVDAHDENAAAARVRELCGVSSRSDLNSPLNTQARLKWHQLDYQFQAWKLRERS